MFVRSRRRIRLLLEIFQKPKTKSYLFAIKRFVNYIVHILFYYRDENVMIAPLYIKVTCQIEVSIALYSILLQLNTEHNTSGSGRYVLNWISLCELLLVPQIIY